MASILSTHGCIMCQKCNTACPLCKSCKCYKKHLLNRG